MASTVWIFFFVFIFFIWFWLVGYWRKWPVNIEYMDRVSTYDLVHVHMGMKASRAQPIGSQTPGYCGRFRHQFACLIRCCLWLQIWLSSKTLNFCFPSFYFCFNGFSYIEIDGHNLHLELHATNQLNWMNKDEEANNNKKMCNSQPPFFRTNRGNLCPFIRHLRVAHSIKNYILSFCIHYVSVPR